MEEGRRSWTPDLAFRQTLSKMEPYHRRFCESTVPKKRRNTPRRNRDIPQQSHVRGLGLLVIPQRQTYSSADLDASTTWRLCR